MTICTVSPAALPCCARPGGRNWNGAACWKSLGQPAETSLGLKPQPDGAIRHRRRRQHGRQVFGQRFFWFFTEFRGGTVEVNGEPGRLVW